jgi:putative endonuclease
MTKASVKSSATPWQVYILECSDGTLYTGVTVDLERRVMEHNGEEGKGGKGGKSSGKGGKSSGKGAKYTRARRPVSLVYSCAMEGRSEATKEEWRIKQLSRGEKLELIRG